MASAEQSGTRKGRLLFLRQYLLDHTDAEHTLTTEELISACTENGYPLNRQTLASDVATLTDTGCEVITEKISNGKTKTNAYYTADRLFELNEVKLLIDAVAASQVITREKTDHLVERLCSLTNEQNRPGLTRGIYTEDRIKTTTYNVLANIDTIFHAIDAGKKISFHYWDYTPEKKKQLKHDGQLYTGSPYALIWEHDRYYAITWCDIHEKIIRYRVDRMSSVTQLDEDAKQNSQFNAVTYTRSMTKMYDDNLPPRNIILRCDNRNMNNVIDHFGEKVRTAIADEKTFRAFVSESPSSTFFAWVSEYRGHIRIAGPADVKQAYEKFLENLLEQQRAQQAEEEQA